MTIQETIDNKMCSGCGACSAVCPTSAISMSYTTIGNKYPSINDTCIDCGLCTKVCPGTANTHLFSKFEDSNSGFIKKAYIGKSLNEEYYKNAQSGGLVTQIIAYLFDKKMIDAAVVAMTTYGYEFPVEESALITNKNQLYASQKSIYTPVDTLSALRNAKNYSSIAVVGLPCQMASIEKGQKNGRFKNVTYRLGLICDRTLSRMITKSLIYEVPELANAPRDFLVYFRDKSEVNSSYRVAPICFETKEGQKYYVQPYPRHELKDFYTHPRCYICPDKLNVFADITFGDPWGMEGVDWQNGSSLIISRTEKGNNILTDAFSEGYIHINECSVTTVKKKQYILSRKERFTSAVKAYRAHRWKYPEEYDSMLAKRSKSSSDKDIASKINSFIKNEQLAEKEILQEANEFRIKYRKKQKRQALKNRILSPIKKIVKKILGRK